MDLSDIELEYLVAICENRTRFVQLMKSEIGQLDINPELASSASLAGRARAELIRRREEAKKKAAKVEETKG